MFVSKQELPRSSLSVSPTCYNSHGLNLLDARHLVPLVPSRYPFFKGNSAVTRQLCGLFRACFCISMTFHILIELRQVYAF